MEVGRRVLFLEIVLFFIFVTKVYNNPNDLVFIVERSSNITEFEYNSIIDFLCNLTDFMTIGPNDTTISVLTFSNSVRIEFALKDYTNKSELLQSLSALKQVKTDGVASSLQMVVNVVRFYIFEQTHGARHGANRTIIFLTKMNVQDSVLQQLQENIETDIHRWDLNLALSMLSDNKLVQIVCRYSNSLLPILNLSRNLSSDCQTIESNDENVPSLKKSSKYSDNNTISGSDDAQSKSLLITFCSVTSVLLIGLVLVVWKILNCRKR